MSEKLRYEKIELSFGPYSDVIPQNCATLAEVKEMVATAIEKAKANRKLVDPHEERRYPYITAEVSFYFLHLHPTAYQNVIWANIQWLKHGGEYYADCKERLKVKTHHASRYRDNKPDVFWDIVADLLTTGAL